MKLFGNPTWSFLRRLGQSPLMKLTILIPFVGSLIIFNDQVFQFFQLSSEWLGMTNDAVRSASLSRLELTYVGLVFLGVGSFLFALSCPIEIQRYASDSEFIEGETPLTTETRVGLLVQDVADDYRQKYGEERSSKFVRNRAYPFEGVSHFEATYAAITREIDSVGESDDGSAPPWNTLGVYTMTDEVNVDRVAEIVWAHRRFERAFWEEFYKAAASHVRDLLALNYFALDHSHPIVRITVAGCYGIGFFVLIIPTVETFFLIATRILPLS